MNKMYKSFGFIAAVAAMSLVSCQKQELRPSTEGATITVNATVEDAANLTKTSIEEVDGVYNVNWDENEVMQAVVWNEADNDDVASSAFAKEADGTGIFSVTIPAGEWTNIAGIYPSESSSKTSGDSQSRWRINLPTAQTPAAGSYDPKAYVLIARPATLPSDLTGYEYNAFYYRATALNRFRINNLEHGGNIVSARITFPEGQKVSGHKRVDLTTTTVTSYNANNLNYVDLNYAAAPLAATDSNYDLWFTTWGVSVSAEETVTVEITTEDYKYTKSFTGNTAEFKENCLNLLALNMTGAEAEELTPADDDYSGLYLIIAKDSENWTYMGGVSGSRFGVESTTIPASRDFSTLTANDFIGAESFIWTVAKVDGGYNFTNTDGKYLSLPNDNGAGLSDNAVTLQVTLMEDGTFQIKNPSYSNRYLQLNTGNNPPYFANYRDNFNQGADIYLLPWVESTEPTLIVNEPEKTVTANAESVSFDYIARNIEGSITAVEATDESDIISTVSVDEGASTVNVALNPNSDEVEKTATVTLSAEGVDPVTLTINQRARPAAGTKYYVKVTEEPADWSGNYIIVFEDVNRIYKGSLTEKFEGSSSIENYYDVAIDNNQIVATDDVISNGVAIENHSGSYAIKTASGYYISRKADSNGVDSAANYSSDCNVTINMRSDGDVEITGVGGRTMLYNKSANYIRFYSSSNIGKNDYPSPSLYRLSE